VVAEEADGLGAVTAVHTHQPDVVVMDLRMPGLDGIEATRRIVGASPHVAVLVLTMYEDDASVFSAMRAGARGYLLKGADQAEIVRAVAAVAGGEAIFGAAVATRILEFFAAPHPSRAPEAVFPQLTAREHEVLDLIAAGRSNSELAGLLFLSPKTVRNHVSNIFAKLQVADRAQAIVVARDAGLGR
jgi:DNA-binding NarL/FixJ family response regulator